MIIFGFLGLGSLGFYLWREGAKPAANASIKTVAVLPFKPLVLENRDKSLEMGMADALISRIGGNREIIVRPLGSVRKYGALEQDAMQAGRELNVDSVLDGSIQRWADKIRVNARLVKVADGKSLWNGTFDEKFTDIFTVQDIISEKVAAALASPLGGNAQSVALQRPTQNTEAYEFYLRGRYHYFQITPTAIRKAIAFYQQAIDVDPRYALAYVGMADAYRTLPIAGFAASKQVFPQTKAAARRALEIDENLTEAHMALGLVEFWYEWNWSAAESRLKKAIELSPNSADARRSYAHLLSNLGRHDEAVAEMKRARELDPLSLITNALEGQCLFYAGRDAEAIVRLEKTLELNEIFWIGRNALGRVYLFQNRYDEAIAEFNRAKEFSGGSTEPVTQLGYALAKSGKRKQATAVLTDLTLLSRDSYVPAYSFAMIHNGLGETEEALNYLEKSFQEREAQLTFVKVDTRWNDLRSNPRFARIIEQMNFG